MNPNSLARLVIMASLANLLTSGAFFLGRPDLSVRESSEKMFATAMTLEKEGKFEEASKLYHDIFFNMSATLIAPRAGERLADIYRRRLYDVEKAREVLQEAAAYQGSAYAAQAQKDLDFMNTHWGQDGAVLKIWYMASHSYRSGDKMRSLELLNSIVDQHGASTLLPLALMRKAKIHKELGQRELASQTLKKFLANYPKDPAVKEARQILSTLP